MTEEMTKTPKLVHWVEQIFTDQSGTNPWDFKAHSINQALVPSRLIGNMVLEDVCHQLQEVFDSVVVIMQLICQRLNGCLTILRQITRTLLYRFKYLNYATKLRADIGNQRGYFDFVHNNPLRLTDLAK